MNIISLTFRRKSSLFAQVSKALFLAHSPMQSLLSLPSCCLQLRWPDFTLLDMCISFHSKSFIQAAPSAKNVLPSYIPAGTIQLLFKIFHCHQISVRTS